MPVTKPAGWDTYIDSNFRRVTMTAEVTYSSLEADPSLVGFDVDDYFDTRAQLIDGISEVASKWIRIGDDTIGDALPIIDFTKQVGKYSETISDGSGVIVSSTRIDFSSRTVETVEIWGDTARNEFPIDLTIELYSGATPIIGVGIINNGNVHIVHNFITPQVNITSVRVSIVKTQANIRSVVSELSADKRDVLSSSEIVNCKLLEELSPSGNAADFAMGISGNELQLTYLDPGDLNFNDLKQNSKIVTQYGVWNGSEFIFVPGGAYYSNRWSRNEINNTVTVIAYDRPSLLSRKQYAPTAEQNKVLEDAIEDVFVDFGWIASNYSIDSLTTVIPYLNLSKKSHLNALKNLIGVEPGYIYTLRDDILYVRDNAVWTGSADKALIDSLIVQFPQDLASENLITTSAVIQWSEMKIGSSPSDVIEFAQPFIVPAGGTQSITLYWNTIDVVSALDVTTPLFTQSGANISIDSFNAYTWGVTITFENVGGSDEDVESITVSGKAVTRTDLETVYQDNEDIYGVLENVYQNSLIQTLAQSQVVGQSFVDKTARPGLIRQIPTFGDPAIVPGDRISYPYEGGTETGTLWRRELMYDGGLSDILFIKRDV
jgi:hypothetical protein